MKTHELQVGDVVKIYPHIKRDPLKSISNLSMVKFIRGVMGIGLKEAKEFYDAHWLNYEQFFITVKFNKDSSGVTFMTELSHSNIKYEIKKYQNEEGKS